MKEKGMLRDEMKIVLGGVERLSYELWCKDIQDKLFHSAEWKVAKTIGVTISRFPEVDTEQIIMRAWHEGKKVAVPKCFPKDKSMQFYLLEDFKQLETVYFGLREPIVSKVSACHKNAIDLMLVPGLLFDKEGYRIGFGGGYYDRYLTDFQGVKISLAFAQQVVEKVPTDIFDIPVHKLVTNEAEYGDSIGK